MISLSLSLSLSLSTFILVEVLIHSTSHVIGREWHVLDHFETISIIFSFQCNSLRNKITTIHQGDRSIELVIKNDCMKFQEFNTRDDEERIYKYNLKYLPTQKKIMRYIY